MVRILKSQHILKSIFYKANLRFNANSNGTDSLGNQNQKEQDQITKEQNLLNRFWNAFKLPIIVGIPLLLSIFGLRRNRNVRLQEKLKIFDPLIDEHIKDLASRHAKNFPVEEQEEYRTECKKRIGQRLEDAGGHGWFTISQNIDQESEFLLDIIKKDKFILNEGSYDYFKVNKHSESGKKHKKNIKKV